MERRHTASTTSGRTFSKATDEQSNDSSMEEEQTKSETSFDKTRRLWRETKLDLPALQTMAKGALAPTIALAAYQSPVFAETYTTSGYLVALAAVLSFPILPRAKFVQSVIILLSAIAVTFAGSLFAIFCCVNARSKASDPRPSVVSGPNTVTYDSSAAAVAGLFLFLQIYTLNTVRAIYPQFTAPGTLIGIFCNITLAYAPQFQDMNAGIVFIYRLLQAMLTGTGLAVAVSLFIFPTNMRGVVFTEMTTYIQTMRKLMRANMEFLHSLEKADMFTRTPTGRPDKPRTSEAQQIKDILADLTAVHAKLGVDMPFAKREVAYGKLGPDDLKEIFRKLRVLIFTMVGYSSLNDVFERTTEQHGWQDLAEETPLDEDTGDAERRHAESVEDWHQISGMLKGPFQHITGHIDDAFAHILIVLQLLRKKKALPDLEAGGTSPIPGDVSFTDFYGKRVDEFRGKKVHIIKQFCESRGIELPPEFFKDPKHAQVNTPEWYNQFPRTQNRQRYRRQLYTILFMDFLLESIASRVHEFCIYVDEKAESGKLRKRRLVVPGYKRLRKSIRQMLSHRQDNYHDETSGLMNEDGHRTPSVYLGSAHQLHHDPEHLPPETKWEVFGDYLRKVPHFLRSKESIFGLRVALGTMCLAVVGYLSNTRSFYIYHRLFWAQTIVSISMTPSAAQSLFGFLLRLFGTFAAMCTSMAAWYIVDGAFAGVIVLYWFFMLWGLFIILKFPKITPVGLIYSITNTLIIAYEIQAVTLGRPRATANGQAYYPAYLLAPYRLAAVSAGLLLAWIWTIFPFPLSEHSELRRDLGSALCLLANYNSVMDETVRARIHGDADLTSPSSPYLQLEKARNKVYAKSTLTLQTLRTHTKFLKYDVPIGGRFPAETYNRIINRVQSIFNFIALVVHASQTFADMCDVTSTDDTDSATAWLKDFRALVDDANVSSRECTTLLSLLSAAVTSGNPLPPYLKAPQAYSLAARLDAMDRDILSIKHVAEPGFAAFACVQIGTKCIEDDVRALLRDVRTLVGEMDFGYRATNRGGRGKTGRGRGGRVRSGDSDDEEEVRGLGAVEEEDEKDGEGRRQRLKRVGTRLGRAVTWAEGRKGKGE
ncbi:ER transporter-like protein 2 [Elsinoe fawcettii]|nr:ER transporter-like protein 2 [Elsinoe fawcettii]